MKARFLALVALVLGLASCQKDTAGFDVTVDGEVSTTVTVNLADASSTRAGGTNSANSAIANDVVADDYYTLRYILQVFDENGATSKNMVVKHSDESEVSFDIRLVPNRHYNFVVWADIVEANSVQEGVIGEGLHYTIGETLKEISLKTDTWVAMDETRDAYTGVYSTKEDGDNKPYSATSSINLTLTRPFAKLRVVTTDMAELFGGVEPAKAIVTYSTEHRTTFDALAQLAGNANTSVSHTFAYADVFAYGDNNNNNKVLFTDYFFAANQDDVVKFVLDVKEANDTPIRTTNFNTDIPVKRNYLTTITGNVLTDGNKINVDIDDNFGENNQNQIVRNTISSAAEFFAAIKNGGDYILISDLNLSSASTASKFAATRASGSKTINIDLNDLTINVDNQTGAPLVELEDGDVLIFSGEGEVTASTNSGKLVDGGNVVVTGDVAVDEKAADAKTGLEALKFICANGGEFTFTENLTASEVVLVSTSNPVVINGNDKALSTSANRAIRVAVSNANLTINDLNISSSAAVIYPSDVRGISIDASLSGVQMTLNNCSIDFTDITTNDWTYAVNVSGSGTGHKVTVNGGVYEGANVVNAHSAKNTIVVKNATLNSLYPNSDQYYGACIWVLQNQESSVYAEGNTFNGNNAIAFNLGTGTTLEEKNNTDNTKCVAAKVGSTYYYNVAEAINAAEDGATVKVLRDHTCKVGATVAKGKTLTLDLNGKTITGTDSSTGSYALITNQGNLTVTGKGTMTLVATNNRAWNAYSSVISNTVGGKLVVENGTIEHLGGTDMAYGIDNLTNGKGTYAETVINGGTIKSTYRAVRMFLNGIEAQNLLTVNGGTIEGTNKSIWMQDPSKNANTGTLVVNEGATLNGDVYLFVTAGSTEWPVSVSIAASAVNGEVLTGNVPERYKVELVNGAYVVNKYEVVSNAADLQAALGKGKNIVLDNDLTIVPDQMMTAPYGNKMALSQNGGVFDGNGKNISVTADGDNYVVMTNGGTIKDLDIDRGFRGIVLMYPNQDVYVDYVNIGVDDEVCYTINTAEGDGTHSLYVSNSVLNGWCSIGTAVKYVSFNNCTFGQGTYYTNVYGRLVKPYVNALFENCDFCDKCYIDLSAFVGTKVVVKNCTVNGVKITAENWTSLVAPENTCGEGQISVELKNGTYLTAENVVDYIVFE